MRKAFVRQISVVLLFTLAWSCAGLGFGMIGHTIEMNNIDHDVTLHECCAANVDETGAAHTSVIDHHTSTVATLSIIDLLIGLFVATAVALFAFVSRFTDFERRRCYARIWYERWSYFALYLRQLFSIGILHPKTW